MLTPRASERDVDLVLSLVGEVKDLAMRWFDNGTVEVRTKDHGSPVTQADVEVERRLRELIAEKDPGAAVLGEEGGLDEGRGSRRRFVDPIDGTFAFARGVPLFSTLVALHDEHGPSVGAISLPALSEVVIAGRGHGCFRNGARCRVSNQPGLRGGVVTSYGFDGWPLSLVGSLQREGARLKGWGDAYGWALVATGRADAVIDMRVEPWDLAPMQVILPEAGGRFSDQRGEDSIASGSAVGSNGLVHPRLLELLASRSD